MPACITTMLPSRSLADIRAQGSWWHERSVLPPYLDFTFSPATPGIQPAYSLMFDLRNGNLLKVGRFSHDGYEEVDLAKRCSPAEEKALQSGGSIT
jgi:hypothetical protein